MALTNLRSRISSLPSLPPSLHQAASKSSRVLETKFSEASSMLQRASSRLSKTMSNTSSEEESDDLERSDTHFDLRYELLLHVFLYLGPKDLARVSMVSKRWNQASAHSGLWRQHLEQDGYALLNDSCFKTSLLKTPKDIYRGLQESVHQPQSQSSITPVRSQILNLTPVRLRKTHKVCLLGLKGSGHWNLLENLMTGLPGLACTGLQSGYRGYFAGIRFDFNQTLLNINALKVCDLRFFATIRQHWSDYITGLGGLIFVVNTATPEQIDDSRAVLTELLQSPPEGCPALPSNVSLLIVANVPSPTATTEHEPTPHTQPSSRVETASRVAAGLQLADLCAGRQWSLVVTEVSKAETAGLETGFSQFVKSMVK